MFAGIRVDRAPGWICGVSAGEADVRPDVPEDKRTNREHTASASGTVAEEDTSQQAARGKENVAPTSTVRSVGGGSAAKGEREGK